MERYYRNSIDQTRLIPFTVKVKESDLFIYADKNLFSEAEKFIKEVRLIIKEYILNYPDFLHTLKPYKIENKNCNEVIKSMIKNSKKANVGPMASVAGVVAEYVGKKLLKYSKEVIVENGGDIFFKVDEPVSIGVYAGKSPLSMKFAIFIEDVTNPFSVCTSSGSFGHSLSFGKADAVCIVSKNSALADAVATSTANLIKSESDIEKATQYAKSIKGVEGAVIIMNGKASFWGNIEIKEL